MCGLAGVGYFGGRTGAGETTALLERMADAIAHRGPDAREIMDEGQVGLAFARLSLVDPAGGGQPLWSTDGNLVLIANGEVYNHRELAAELGADAPLKTDSDCEVLLYLYRRYGEKFLDRVRGMFAIILWDRASRQLILARDRFGIKPLFLHRDRDRVVMASEIKALFTDAGVRREVDWATALTNPHLNAAAAITQVPLTTWFKDIESVPAATVVRIDLADGATTSHRYWDLPDPVELLAASDDELILRYRHLLEDSVAECATADAELGVFLSGGVDSAAVAALARGTAGDLHTFTVLSASTLLNGDGPGAAEVARQLGVPNHQLVFEADRIPGVDEWKRLLWLMETPICGPEQFYKHELHRYAKAVRPELRGMLLGAAADEFAGGYTTTLAGQTDWPGFLGNLRMMARNDGLRRHPSMAPWWNGVNGPFVSEQVLDLPADPYAAYLRYEYEKVQQYNCWHEDRSAAGSGIEARVPFLDHRLVEFLVSLPAGRRETLLWDKRILREAVGDVVPAAFAQREKVPFYWGPFERYTHQVFVSMLTQGKAQLVEEAVAAPDADRYLDGDRIRAALERLGDRPDSIGMELLLRLVNVGLLASMTASLPTPPLPTRGSLTVLAPESADPSDMALAARLGCAVGFPADSIAELADGVLVLSSSTDPGTLYLTVSGTTEFVIDSDAPAWLALFSRIEGGTTVADVVAGLDEDDAEEVRTALAEAVGMGLIRVAN
ncbi:asparagine synthase (glutamine-hydrolyzing) [Symbioplanes lichenis]|uniref:asparagine synthase (glutamine-hydrolyzing) n=1 Tax=Symbioplanes lichenis TaxID=1629072 RepID=UPI002738A2AC|nr:asparagine synthase (glutamine-hydrolyzing) [Actinoplanes lichenis]